MFPKKDKLKETVGATFTGKQWLGQKHTEFCCSRKTLLIISCSALPLLPFLCRVNSKGVNIR